MKTFGINLEKISYSLFDIHRNNSSLNLGNEIKFYIEAIIPINPKFTLFNYHTKKKNNCLKF